ncbi:hypothetical protein FKW77_007593 [Venturia effusa]|uniref:Uncharacterized protein n=1 Tax=Venturia effusa TaxID=50376 RepID=A0A517LE46_9PEZI|nr:hypothetical protein FKW77_007593 [Venturia effusa]
MLLSALLPFFLVESTLATPLTPPIPADLGTFQTAFNDVISAMKVFDTAVLALSSGSALPEPKPIVNALSKGTTSLKASAVLDINDAVNLLDLSNNLVATTNTTINDLVAKKSVVDAAGIAADVAKQLNGVKSASKDFIAAAVSKLPEGIQPVAQDQASQIVTIIDGGIKAFGGTVSRMLLW